MEIVLTYLLFISDLIHLARPAKSDQTQPLIERPLSAERMQNESDEKSPIHRW